MARPLGADPDFLTYDAALDYRWSKHPELWADAEAVFWQKTGWAPGELAGRRVLDFGCGNGAFTLVAARAGARVLAVDPGPLAVTAARAHVEQAGLSTAVRVHRADLFDLSALLEDEAIDAAYALGSLHVTSEPHRAFRELARTVRRGGQLAVWLQCEPLTTLGLRPVLEFLHDLTREVSPERLYELICQYAPTLRELYAGAWGDLQQLVRIANEAESRRCVASTYAWHAARYRSGHTVEEARGWYEREGFTVDWVGDFPVTLRGTRYSQSARGVRQRQAQQQAQQRAERRAQTGKPRVLLISDVRGWAFDQNFHDLAEYLANRFDFDHGYVWEWVVEHTAPFPDFEQYDVIFAPYHRWGIEDRLPLARTLGALRSQWVFPERKRPPEAEEFAVVNRYAAYQVVTQRNYDELIAHCPRVVYLTNPVNLRRFPEPSQQERVVASWNGNAGHSNLLQEDVKGFHSVVQPACAQAQVPLAYAEYTLNRLQPEEMPEFYRQANVALCASLYEGTSSSVLEAMGAGLAVIATDVGNHRELHESMLARQGDSGMVLVEERSVGAFVAALHQLKRDPARISEMGRLNREEIQMNWSWDVWQDRFADFLRLPLGEARP